MSVFFTREMMRADIAAAIHTQPEEVGDDDNLMDLGLDSMRALNLVLLWQERGVTLDFSELAEEVTLSGWWAVSERHLHRQREAAA
ncbi:phosphopantetheine-binding protein [Afifella marina]|uniref:Aryl carrier domain-containing protein n=1 Tax=Afifella marina DSM 2698 TaxID=1120955 RepID=A0A1G5NV35_AFIMA|nr:phosphopantetheine-binding protein [Afifella marina]MBK1624143.1 phosphopantetheine-binding protein [Afifella marina DSM 2698]MBK1627700.1 phosphopantetheine-binding protein [Afifella marina]MBK5916424.1 phosphopantetheine-binding protein [Afifella marina]RAI20978.1 phosphopantetheine-binding protein [Afifella marina DSM 2698]SCZ40689.1 Aryl carrier domain-containing protein [Afifella marina DSM 2698]